MSDDKATVAKAPCKSCPYRQDVPSGVWDATEYDKLPAYDGEILHQLLSGGEALFYCHQQDGRLCAGWVGCHIAQHNGHVFAIRLMRGSLDTRPIEEYATPVPLFESGMEAALHGLSGVDHPTATARKAIDKLARKAARRGE